MFPQARKTKEKNKQMGLLKNFFTAKKTVSKMKRHPTERENKLNKDTSGNGLISKFYKELKILNTKIGFLIQLKNGWRTWIDTSPKRTFRWSIDTEKMFGVTNQQRNAGLQARSQVGGLWEATDLTQWCFSPSVSPSLPLSLKVNK